MTNENNGIAFIKYTNEKTFEIFVKYGYKVTELYKANSYKYDDCLNVVAIDGIIFTHIGELVFSF